MKAPRLPAIRTLAPVILAASLAACGEPYPPLEQEKLLAKGFRATVEGYELPRGILGPRLLQVAFEGGKQASFLVHREWYSTLKLDGFDCNEARLWDSAAPGWVCFQKWVPSEKDTLIKAAGADELELREWGTRADTSRTVKRVRIVGPGEWEPMQRLKRAKAAATDTVLELLEQDAKARLGKP